MAVINRISEQEFRELALTEPDHRWELWDGMLVEKPPMSIAHNDVAFYLGHLLQGQLDRGIYRVNVNGDRARLSPRTFYIPDVVVIPVAHQQMVGRRAFGAYAEPLPFVAEVWSPSTGEYDIAAKLPAYRERGDHEIWFIHPYERTITAWRRQGDGAYTESRYEGGIVPVLSLPGVTIDIDDLLAE